MVTTNRTVNAIARRILRQPFGVVDILVSCQAAMDRAAVETDAQMGLSEVTREVRRAQFLAMMILH